MFTSADADSSGGLSKDEFSSMMDKLSAASGRHGPHSAPPPPPPSEETSGSEDSATDSTAETSRLDELFAAADADGDGEVTLVEQEDALASMQGAVCRRHHRFSGWSSMRSARRSTVC